MCSAVISVTFSSNLGNFKIIQKIQKTQIQNKSKKKLEIKYQSSQTNHKNPKIQIFSKISKILKILKKPQKITFFQKNDFLRRLVFDQSSSVYPVSEYRGLAQASQRMNEETKDRNPYV